MEIKTSDREDMVINSEAIKITSGICGDVVISEASVMKL